MVICAVSRLTLGLVDADAATAWQDTDIVIGGGMPTRLFDVLSGSSVDAHSTSLAVGPLFSQFPVALLFGERAPERAAAVLSRRRGS